MVTAYLDDVIFFKLVSFNHNILWTLIKVIYIISLFISKYSLCVVSIVWPTIMLPVLMAIVGALRDNKRHSTP